MASVFTFDPDPPRVSSPWSTPRASTSREVLVGDSRSSPGAPEDCSVTRLEAEPQEGPTEYKLHLLLRRRRSFVSCSTVQGPRSGAQRSMSASGTNTSRLTPTMLARTPSQQLMSSQHRHARLEQLTTQLFWRLQQSAPHHSSAFSKTLAPPFPSKVPVEIGSVVSGLEESKGALYEVGVADDGTFVGLAADEMEESLNTLRIMAASLGCYVDVLRMVDVGVCAWLDDRVEMRQSKLWVAEAHVKPNLGRQQQTETAETEKNSADDHSAVATSADNVTTPEQLRVSLTGATMSGKSSLLGSLTTATLDNGRGKSRLSLLKHRHEIASGMTSSVTQELLGYTRAEVGISGVHVVNYAAGNVSSWTDVHAGAQSGRLVLLSDSAGHPRYRRTTVRGLIGWDPHWTLICIPADDTEDTSGMTGSTPPPQEVFGIGAGTFDADLSRAHLELCLTLNLPLIVVITKLDLASKSGLRDCLSKILTALKAAGRKPLIQPDSHITIGEPDLLTIAGKDIAAARDVSDKLRYHPERTVPIILTSAVKGNGICKLHAMLHELPIRRPPIKSRPGIPPNALFHIEDVYSCSKLLSDDVTPLAVLSGRMQYGNISIGDEMILGPYLTEFTPEDGDCSPSTKARPFTPESQSFPGALSHIKGFSLRPVTQSEEWQRVKVVSVRNLRLPVASIQADQVSTVGIVPRFGPPVSTQALMRIRKGMVLANGTPQSCRVFEAEFARQDVEGLSIRSGVVVYTASVRASATVIAGAVVDDNDEGRDSLLPSNVKKPVGGSGFSFGYDDDDDDDVHNNDVEARLGHKEARILVTFHLIASREYVEVGAQVLIMPGGGPGLYGGTERGQKGIAGLEGYVGRVTKVVG